jgi:hypothetical protein
MIFEDRIQVNPRLFRLKDPRTNEIVDFEIQDLLPEEIEQEGTEVDAAYLNGLLTYSMEEKQVGYWIDGKPLYRKVINFGNLPNRDVKRVNHNISNIGRVIKLTGMTQVDLGGTYGFSWSPLPLVYSGSEYIFNTTLSCNKTEIVCKTTEDRSGFSAYIIIEYTKTTD